MRAPDRVHAADERREAARVVEVPVAQLVLLRVEVLLAAGLARRALEQLERRPVDAVGRAERRRQHEARLERRPAAVLEVGVEDVGRVRRRGSGGRSR